MIEVKRVFMVDGKPFFPLGGQARNASGYNDTESETAFKAVKLLRGNTLEIPVYWDQVEPEEGKFDFTGVDALLASARRYAVKLILLWFATWKNGTMDYAPAWVKTNPQRFKRVISPNGNDLWVLSSHCTANFEADKKAFTKLCKHLKAKDGTEQTVIALQVENEPGIIGSDRDYGPEAQAVFDSPVPAELVAAMKAAGTGQVYDLWQQAGGKESGTWSELFGWSAGELMTAWSIATYIDGIAEAGKASYDIPMFINAAPMEVRWSWSIPGETYSSGAPVTKVLDIYKWFTPHVDLIAPDIYIPDPRGHESLYATYARDDNPLFVPESAPIGCNTWNMFRAIADYNAIGYHFFGVESIFAEDGSIRPECQMMIDSFWCVASAIPLLLKYQGAGKVRAVVQEEFMPIQRLDLDGYLGLIQFGEGPAPRAAKDWRHTTKQALVTRYASTESNRGRGLVFQTSQHEFYLVGDNYRLFLRPKLPPEKMRASPFASDSTLNRLAHHFRVDEGHFDQNGEFVVDRQRNGDEINYGLWVEPDIGVLRAIMCGGW